jgi:hypothetical protein
MVWMYWTLAHKPGGQPIGALERAFGSQARQADRPADPQAGGGPLADPQAA